MSNSTIRKVEVAREGTNVVLTMRCADAYDAVVLYGHVVDEMRSGGISISLETVKGEPERAP